MKHQTPTKQIASALNEGWLQGGSFIGSILAGTLLGYLGDLWLGTEPWLLVLGISLGSYSGFMRMWHSAKQMEETDRER